MPLPKLYILQKLNSPQLTQLKNIGQMLNNI